MGASGAFEAQRQSTVKMVALIHCELSGPTPGPSHIRNETCGRGAIPSRQGRRATQYRFGALWKLILKMFEPSAMSTWPVPMAWANAPVPLLTAKV